MLALLARMAPVVGALSLSGCLLVSPHNGQTLPSRTAAVPFQAWTIKTGDSLVVECMPTNRFGPEVSPHGAWTRFATLPVSADASLDRFGAKAYSASAELSLPDSCWYLNRTNGWSYASIRVLQPDYLSAESYAYLTLDRPGSGTDAECVGREVGRSGSWTAWTSARCYNHTASGRPIPWLMLRTEG